MEVENSITIPNYDDDDDEEDDDTDAGTDLNGLSNATATIGVNNIVLNDYLASNKLTNESFGYQSEQLPPPSSFFGNNSDAANEFLEADAYGSVFCKNNGTEMSHLSFHDAFEFAQMNGNTNKQCVKSKKIF